MKIPGKKISTQKAERILAIIAFALIVIAWLAGTFRAQAGLFPFLEQILPQVHHFKFISPGHYAAWKDPEEKEIVGYVATGTAPGYGGDMILAVALSPEGSVIGLEVVTHRETAAFFSRVMKKDVLDGLKGKKFSDPFELGRDVDSISGATYSTRAIAEAARQASRKIASKNLGYTVEPEPTPTIQFGIPEAVLFGLFLFGIIGRMRRFKYKKTVRWISMLTGLLVLGFIFNKPLTLVLINKMLLGFWPPWQLNLYWYILLFGILFVYSLENKNPYCEWFCPFGATQECLAVIGGGKISPSKNIHSGLRWFQRALALGAIVFALLYRNPSISSYEVFGTFFHLIGTNFHFVLLGIVLIAALFIRRPWCSYLCPLRPVTDFIRLVRNWVREVWQKLMTRKIHPEAKPADKSP